MSVYTCLICISNGIMPVAGVAIYHMFGGNLNSYRFTGIIIFLLRLAAACVWLLYWRRQSIKAE